jgi:microcystin-dependent protein
VPSYHPFDSTSVLSPGLDPAVIRPAPGAGQAHENMMPHLAINFVIALTGAFPSRN